MDAYSLRNAAWLLIGTLLLGLAFAGSYVGALHEPTPHGVQVAVAGPPQATAPVVRQLRRRSGEALDLRTVATRRAGLREIDEREVYGVLVPGRRASELIVASAAGVSVAALLRREVRRAADPGRRVTVVDSHPLPADDSRGLSPFYLAIGWVVTGYLGATAVGLVRGMSAGGRRLAAIRLGVFAVYALLAGVLSAILMNTVIGTLEGHGVRLALIGALTVFATAAITTALETLLGLIGTGVVLLLFVVLGNPGSGGPYPRELLPGLWRVTGGLLPPGAGTQSVTSLIYFDGNAMGGPLLVLAVYALLGCVVVIAVGRVRRTSSPELAGASALGA